MPASPRFARLAAAGLLAAFAAAGCGGRDERPHVLLVSLDTLRADAVAGMPHLARRAREGLAFPRVYAASNWTLPSHVSLLLSQPYSRHRLPSAERRPPFTGATLDPAATTLAEAFAAAGYRTVASTEGGYLDSYYGFARGFDVYRMTPALLADPAADIDRHRVNVLAAAKRLDRRPVFALVHTYRVHDYALNDPRFHRFLDPGDAEWAARGSLLDRMWRNDDGAPPAEFLERLYRGAAADADEHLERLITDVTERIDDRPWLVVVTSDHGENFDVDPSVRSHGTALIEQQLRVPWIVWSETPRWRPRIAPAPFAAAIDLAPSLLAYLGIPVPASFEGRGDRLRSQEGRGGAEEAEAAFFPYRKTPGRHYQLGVVAADRAVVRSENAGTVATRCYARVLDRPGFTVWSAAERPATCESLDRDAARRIRRWLAAGPRAPAPPAASEAESEKLHRDLKALGYL